MNSVLKPAAATVLAVVLSGCGTDEYRPEEGMSAADIYAVACQDCHGEKGQGRLKGYVLKLAGIGHEPEDISDKIRDGGTFMPGFPNIGKEERLAVAEYINEQ